MSTINRDKLHRTGEGRFQAGVYIAKDGYGGFVAKVLIPLIGPQPGEVNTELALTLPAFTTFEDAAAAAYAWAFNRLPKIYGFEAADLEISLLDEPQFS